MTTNLADCTATELLQLYKTGQASPVEAHAAVTKRIDQLNPTLKGFLPHSPRYSAQAAIKSEAAWQAHRKPRWRSKAAGRGAHLDQRFDLDSRHAHPARQPHGGRKTALGRRRTSRRRGSKTAGAVILGKTSTPEFGCKGETNSPRTGITRNPWDTTKTPGGSSGGTAAAVAAGMGPLSVGTDGAGSVRIPAAFCGNFGLKPSFGRVPAYPLSPFGSVAHLGPHTMSVRDAALMMNVLAQPDARDWTSLPYDGVDYLKALEKSDNPGPHYGVKGLRIAYSPTLGFAKNVHPEIAAALAQAAKQFEALGAIVEQVDPGFDDPLDITTGLWFVGAWTVWNTLSAAQQAVTDPDFKAEAALGAQFSALDVQRLHLRRGALGSHMRQFMQRYDLLLTPAVSIPAFDAKPAGHSPMSPAGHAGLDAF